MPSIFETWAGYSIATGTFCADSVEQISMNETHNDICKGAMLFLIGVD
jgi:hypothetical protein